MHFDKDICTIWLTCLIRSSTVFLYVSQLIGRERMIIATHVCKCRITIFSQISACCFRVITVIFIVALEAEAVV